MSLPDAIVTRLPVSSDRVEIVEVAFSSIGKVLKDFVVNMCLPKTHAPHVFR